ncbi:1,4-beta-xylanase [Amnibacterium flavum]|uniref:Beta-xylanase n=2 Tax=Amnibacterium flavum TaxID=2173173 RepID=A0A2V1HQU5_9MICO|nr:endo-1,4-beta-xylanase [Amnibacterium flavum]PVZ93350.1 1,4-beta-xylanase [Amnibacterium flavum]
MKHRIADATVTVLGADGQPLADTEVTVEQTRHAFSFGNIGFDFIPLANNETEERPLFFGSASLARLPELADQWLELFNTATLPFYWAPFETERGKPDTARLRKTAEWFIERGVTVKGHPLFWHTLAPEWLNELPLDEVEKIQRERVRREVGDFTDLIHIWDAINETVILPVFDKDDNALTKLAKQRGRIEMIKLAFGEARATKPDLFLLINDFDLSPDYEAVIEEVLAAGIKIDAIGLQTHMHQGYRGEDAILAIIDRFARFGLPIHMTESTLLSGHIMPREIEDLNDYIIPDWPSTPEGEERQADEINRHYRSLVSHPAVQAINYWGLTDDGAWLGAPVGFVRKDGSLKPSYEVLRGLIKGEWWLSPVTLRTSAEGTVPVSGFLGDYRVTAGDSSAAFALETAGETKAEARLA